MVSLYLKIIFALLSLVPFLFSCGDIQQKEAKRTVNSNNHHSASAISDRGDDDAEPNDSEPPDEATDHLNNHPVDPTPEQNSVPTVDVPEGPVPQIDFTRYHSQEDISAYLKSVAKAFPKMIQFHTLGKSTEGREIDYISMSKSIPGTVPTLYLNGTHHGDEWSTTEAVLAMINYIIQNLKDPMVSSLLKRYEIFFQPIVNPDGHASTQRENSEGLDLNRDYAFPRRSEADSFKSVETRLVKALLDEKKFSAGIAYHGGTECILWPYGYDWDKTPDDDKMRTIAKMAADAMGFSQYFMSVALYPAEGEHSDYAYMKHRTFSYTFEITNEKIPSESSLAFFMERTVKGTLAFMQGVMAADGGYLTLLPPTEEEVASWGVYHDVWNGGPRRE